VIPAREVLTEAPLPLGLGTLLQVGDFLLVPVIALPLCPGCPVPPLPTDAIVATAADDNGAMLARGVPGPDGVVRLRTGAFHGKTHVLVSGSGVRPVSRVVTLPLTSLP
jgi:hypothetical protein